MRFLCENNLGSRVITLLRRIGLSDVQAVSNDPDPGDAAIVAMANSEERTIVTRDRGFSERRLCAINQGVLYIPQRFEGRDLLLHETFDCISRLLQSDRLAVLGHGVCAVMPDGIEIRTREGNRFIRLQDL